MKIILIFLLLSLSSCQIPTLDEAYTSVKSIKESVKYCPELTICS